MVYAYKTSAGTYTDRRRTFAIVHAGARTWAWRCHRTGATGVAPTLTDARTAIAAARDQVDA